jgi:hypothetical protein
MEVDLLVVVGLLLDLISELLLDQSSARAVVLAT